MKTVKELIEELNKIENKDLEVKTEGCDCYGDWSGNIEIVEDYILIERD
jgi:hypothetical protein